MRINSLASRVALLAVCVAASPQTGRADDRRVMITGVIPTFAPPPQPSTLLVLGTGFSPRGKKAPRPSVYLGAPGGLMRPLEIVEAGDSALRVKLADVPAGTWQLVVSLKKNFDSNRLPIDTGSEVDLFSVTLGAVGASGPQGLVGPQGAAGAIGPVGLLGAAGATGAIGPEGPAGAAGASGADGAVGPVGPLGPAGPQGPAGATGPVGSVGPVGPKGPGF